MNEDLTLRAEGSGETAAPAPAGTPEPPAAPPPALGFLDVVYGVLVRPRETFAAAAAAPPYLAAVLVVAVVAGLRGLAAGAGTDAIWRGVTELSLSLLGMALGAAGLGLVAEMLGGRGRIIGLFALLGLTRVPHLVLLPFAVLGRLWGPAGTLAGIAAFCWTTALTVAAIRSAYRLETGAALSALILGVTALVVVPAVGLVAAVWALLSHPEIAGTLADL